MEVMMIRVSKLRVVLYKVLGYKDLCVVGFFVGCKVLVVAASVGHDLPRCAMCWQRWSQLASVGVIFQG